MLSEGELIREVRVHWDGLTKTAERALRHAYPIIKPHLRREFPREAVQEIIDHVFSMGIEWTSGQDLKMEDIVTEIERLWNGGEKYRCTMGCDAEPVKPVCQTCGGSGEVYKHYGAGSSGEYIRPCPDCTQFTFLRSDGLKYPDQRKGQRRSGKKCRRSILDRRSIENQPVPRMWDTGRREGEERRK